MRILQINTTLNTTSTGRIAEEIGQTLIQHGHQSYIGSARVGPSGSTSHHLQIGSTIDRYLHGMKSRLLDRHGFGSHSATKQLVRDIEEIDPDVISLHNIHGYYLNIEVLFMYLKKMHKPIVWTFHDCWPFTGHCSFFDFVSCEKWKTECNNCPLSDKYPASWWIDNSQKNFHQKSTLFRDIENLEIVTPSHWLKGLVSDSFLSMYPVNVINNGIDINKFRPMLTEGDISKEIYNLWDKYIVLGVANVWDRRKGLNYFLELSERLDKRFKIVLVGLDTNVHHELPDNVLAIPRTDSVEDLVMLYNAADVFINPTLVDNFPTTNLEALACGVPVVTFDTGGCGEAVSSSTGSVVPKRDVAGLHTSVMQIIDKGKASYAEQCRARAVAKYNKDDRFLDYITLYQKIYKQAGTPVLKSVYSEDVL